MSKKSKAQEKDRNVGNGAAQGCRRKAAVSKRYGLLTAREQEVAGLLAKGMSLKQVATVMCISHMAVACHWSRIAAKMQANTRAELEQMLQSAIPAMDLP